MDNLPPDAELDLIQEAKKAEKSVEEERRKALSANIAANRQKKEETVSLVDFADAHGRADLLTWEPVHKWESQPASEKQLAWLRKYHIDTDGMTKGMASQLIDVINAPSRKQLNKLEDFGFEPAGWTKRDCNHVLTPSAATDGEFLPGWEIRRNLTRPNGTGQSGTRGQMSDSKILDALQAVPPASCSYEEWLEIGMALREEGFSVSDWDLWSRSDSRYQKGV